MTTSILVYSIRGFEFSEPNDMKKKDWFSITNVAFWKRVHWSQHLVAVFLAVHFKVLHCCQPHVVAAAWNRHMPPPVGLYGWLWKSVVAGSSGSSYQTQMWARKQNWTSWHTYLMSSDARCGFQLDLHTMEISNYKSIHYTVTIKQVLSVPNRVLSVCYIIKLSTCLLKEMYLTLFILFTSWLPGLLHHTLWVYSIVYLQTALN